MPSSGAGDEAGGNEAGGNEAGGAPVRSGMELQVVLPDESPTMPVRTLVDLARTAEDLGYTTAWLPDHVLPPGEYGATFGGVYEPLVTIGHLTAVTEHLRFGTSVLVAPLRDPFVLAKQVATLHQGVFAPVPEGSVPIMVGGNSDAALRRAARYGDVWQGIPADPGTFAERVRSLAELASPRDVVPALRIGWDGSTPVEQVADAAVAHREAGAAQLAVHFGEHEGSAERMTALVNALAGR